MKHHPVHRQRGVATLIVVMVLFFVVSLVAAYTSRNLIFEQRTSANQYHATQAFEVGDAGLEWAVAMLNAGRIGADCRPSALLTDTTFRERYLDISPTTGQITSRRGPSTNAYLFPTCVFDGTNWACSCPSDSAPSLTPPSGPDTYPAFRIYFRTLPTQPGVVQVYANACTRLDDSCLKFSPSATSANPTAVGATNEGVAAVSVVLGLTGGGALPPVTPLTAFGSVTLTGSALAIYNGDAASGARTVQAAGAVVLDSGASLVSAPGAPGGVATIVEADAGLVALGGDRERFFASVFNVWPAMFREQPAAVIVDCGVGSCSATAVQAEIAKNPGRPIWLTGGLDIDGDLGAPTAPVEVVANGDVNFGTVAADIYGIVYVRKDDWASSGGAATARVHGAVVADGNITGSAAPVLIYDAALLTRLRLTTGSFVRVPGSWKDFQ